MNEQQVLEFLRKLTPEERSKILAGIASGNPPSSIVPKEWQDKTTWQKDIIPALGAAYQSSEGKQYIADIMRSRSGDRFVKRYKPALNLILQGADIFTSLGQINQSNKALAKLSQPNIPQSPGVDPALNNEIYKAQQGSFDQSRALAPARQGINDAYNASLNTAAQVSNGQAGTYQALAQSAANERMRASLGLPAIADNVKAREQQRLDNLISTRGQLAQQDFSNRLAGTNIAMDQYNRNMQAAAALGAQGRMNLRNVFQTLPDNLSRFVGQSTANTAQIDPVKDPYGYGSQLERNIAQSMVANRVQPNNMFSNPLSKYREEYLMNRRRQNFYNHPAYLKD